MNKDPRVGEIEAREALVHVKCADCAKCRVAEEECWCIECEYWGCERGPDCEDDPNPTTVAYLLAELRKAHEALARVETLTLDPEHYDSRGPSNGYVSVDDIRAAVAAANGGGQ